jgi:hypothetical protein
MGGLFALQAALMGAAPHPQSGWDCAPNSARGTGVVALFSNLSCLRVEPLMIRENSPTASACYLGTI